MRKSSRLLLPLLIALAPLPAIAQTDAPVAAPVPAVTTVAVPVAIPALTPAMPGVGQPSGGIAMQAPMTPIAVEAQSLATDVLNPLMIAVSVFVLILLAWTMFRYRAAANPVASKTSHNTTVEVVWTLVPVLILVWIAVPSFRLLANQYSPPKADLTIKATGHQWYWEYEYPDHKDIALTGVMVEDKDLKPGQPRLLATDQNLVMPIDTNIRLQTTAGDVLHSWAMPAFGVKKDAVPGRLNETWFRIEKEGMYYGQCSEICGERHGFMPIAVEAVSKERFQQWVGQKVAERDGDSTVKMAASQP